MKGAKPSGAVAEVCGVLTIAGIIIMMPNLLVAIVGIVAVMNIHQARIQKIPASRWRYAAKVAAVAAATLKGNTIIGKMVKYL
jgi:UPF0716 family protein affecting phage T7 exclusion